MHQNAPIVATVSPKFLTEGRDSHTTTRAPLITVTQSDAISHSSHLTSSDLISAHLVSSQLSALL